MSEGKIIIFSAPSGAGKTTIVSHLVRVNPHLQFSISATTRKPRPNEANGIHYHFLSLEDFNTKIKAGEFVEYEQVYEGLMYGTLKSEIERIWDSGNHVIVDVDVVGALNLKKYFGDKALAIFIKPPNVDVLIERLTNRKTETPKALEKRIKKAKHELSFEQKFDLSILNDKLDQAIIEAQNHIDTFLK
ncbi:guanylate kinase [Flammeovirgaceae bacterium SG7u.111]|nr:guanylate kinase [Flammeovirgaceae bacterium SG7u.132]WPO35776.1 guanylate kinase [Flammeovirgaceae bacterium SG7u.111]